MGPIDLNRGYSLFKRRVMEMANSYRQGVRRIVRRRHALQRQQQTDHFLHLMLLRVSVTNYRLLDQPR